jgi:hypothetical protein
VQWVAAKITPIQRQRLRCAFGILELHAEVVSTINAALRCSAPLREEVLQLKHAKAIALHNVYSGFGPECSGASNLADKFGVGIFPGPSHRGA